MESDTSASYEQGVRSLSLDMAGNRRRNHAVAGKNNGLPRKSRVGTQRHRCHSRRHRQAPRPRLPPRAPQRERAPKDTQRGESTIASPEHPSAKLLIATPSGPGTGGWERSVATGLVSTSSLPMSSTTRSPGMAWSGQPVLLLVSYQFFNLSGDSLMFN
ncbi:hypothetical protein EMPG_15181 [Blastomyces silverae]|uniref:Uncharacterized protein n=1 Tax=Blastomyces silverae TaxID=2060906 RepID=A0A0H1BJT2_9EURO|nr:hypothetical protein EMPG_15181 [Blastomyces silverae]